MASQPVIILDIDDTLIRFNRHLQDWHNKHYGTNIGALTEVNDFDLSKVWGCQSSEVWPRIKEFYGTPEFAAGKPYPGAVSAVEALVVLSVV